MTFQFSLLAYLLVIAVLIGLGIRYRRGRAYLFTAAAVMFCVPVGWFLTVIALFMHAGV
jgi:hypothetical protein